MSQEKTTVGNVCLVLCGVIGAMIAGELALRVAGFSPIHVNPLSSFHEPHSLVGYRGKPNFSGRFRRAEFDVTIEHDEQGFRKQEFQQPRERSERQVLIFGDSFTWGWGVGQGKVFTDQMNRWMPGYHIRNFGLNASGTVQQFAIFESLAQDLVQAGDTVALVFVYNDFRDNVTRPLRAEVSDGRLQRIGPTRLLSASHSAALKRISYLYNYIAFSAAALKETLEERQARRRTPRSADPENRRNAIVVAQYALAEFKQIIEKKGARFLVVYVPQQGEIHETQHLEEGEARNEAAYREAFQTCAESLKLRALDLLPSFLEAKKSRPGERLTFGRDKHWNEHGHALAAKVIAEHILAMDRGS